VHMLYGLIQLSWSCSACPLLRCWTSNSSPNRRWPRASSTAWAITLGIGASSHRLSRIAEVCATALGARPGLDRYLRIAGVRVSAGESSRTPASYCARPARHRVADLLDRHVTLRTVIDFRDRLQQVWDHASATHDSALIQWRALREQARTSQIRALRAFALRLSKYAPSEG
jgi:hypothetical protein